MLITNLRSIQAEHVIFDKMSKKGSVLWSTLNMIPTSY